MNPLFSTIAPPVVALVVRAGNRWRASCGIPMAGGEMSRTITTIAELDQLLKYGWQLTVNRKTKTAYIERGITYTDVGDTYMPVAYEIAIAYGQEMSK